MRNATLVARSLLAVFSSLGIGCRFGVFLVHGALTGLIAWVVGIGTPVLLARLSFLRGFVVVVGHECSFGRYGNRSPLGKFLSAPEDHRSLLRDKLARATVEGATIWSIA